MQKRILSLMLALAMMITVFAGCGGNTGSSESTASQSAASGSSESSASSEAQSSQTSQSSGEETVVRMNIGSEPTAWTPGSLPPLTPRPLCTTSSRACACTMKTARSSPAWPKAGISPRTA